MTKLHRPVSISLTGEMIAKVDEVRGDIPRSRYVLRLLEKEVSIDSANS